MAEIPKEMLRAQTNVILLNVLKQGDNYVYGIIKQVKEASNGEMELNERSIRSLKDLKRMGLSVLIGEMKVKAGVASITD